MVFDLLGDLLSEALKFADSGFDGELVLRDETSLTDAPAKELFSETDGRWFMRPESLPGDLCIKAIAVDGEGLYLETSPLNDANAREEIAEAMLPVLYDAEKRAFVDVHRQLTLVTISEPKVLEKGLDDRCLWTVPLRDVSTVRRLALVQLLDLLYSRSCFEVSEQKQSVAPPTSMALVQKMSLGLQQRLTVEQRPMLSLKATLGMTAKMELRTELRMLLSLERRIVSMSPEELLDFVVDHISERGEAWTKNVLLFTLAGNIKRTMPKFTWKEARMVARKLTAAEKAA